MIGLGKDGTACEATGDAHPPRLADVSGAGRPGSRRLRRADGGGAARPGSRARACGRGQPRRWQAPPPAARHRRPGGRTPLPARRSCTRTSSSRPGSPPRSRPRAPLVVTAHGQDVAQRRADPGRRRRRPRFVVRRAAAVVAVSDWLRRELESKVAGRAREGRGRRLRRRPRAASPSSRRPRGRRAFVCVGSLTERKNPLRLAHAFERLGEGTLTFVGDGPLRAHLEGRAGSSVTGRVPHDEVPARLAAARVVCGPSLVEPFGQSLLEAMASGRPVVATQVGGPPEFVHAGGGRARRPARRGRARSTASAAPPRCPCPNDAAREAAAAHDVRRQAEKVEAILQRAARGRPA